MTRFIFALADLSTFHWVENKEKTKHTEIMKKTAPMSNGSLCLCATWAPKEELTWARETQHSTAPFSLGPYNPMAHTL